MLAKSVKKDDEQKSVELALGRKTMCHHRHFYLLCTYFHWLNFARAIIVVYIPPFDITFHVMRCSISYVSRKSFNITPFALFCVCLKITSNTVLITKRTYTYPHETDCWQYIPNPNDCATNNQHENICSKFILFLREDRDKTNSWKLHIFSHTPPPLRRLIFSLCCKKLRRMRKSTFAEHTFVVRKSWHFSRKRGRKYKYFEQITNNFNIACSNADETHRQTYMDIDSVCDVRKANLSLSIRKFMDLVFFFAGALAIVNLLSSRIWN